MRLLQVVAGRTLLTLSILIATLLSIWLVLSYMASFYLASMDKDPLTTMDTTMDKASGDLSGNPMIGIGFLVAAACSIAGWYLVEGRKNCILFLRSFHTHGPNRFVVDLLQRHLGKRFRMVALDDGNIEAPRAKGSDRLVALWGCGTTIVFFYLISTLFYPHGRLSFSAMMNMISFYMCMSTLAMPLDSARRSRKIRNRYAIAAPADLQAVARVVKRFSSWSLRASASRSMVISVSGEPELWQDVVRELYPLVHGVIIDVSDPTASILWELEFLSQEGRGNFILIGQEDLFHGWRCSAGNYPVVDQLNRLLEGREIFGYDVRQDLRRASKEIVKLLDKACAGEGSARKAGDFSGAR